MKRKLSRKAVKKKLDVLCSRAIRAIYPRCVVCGRTDGLSAHHCIKRKGQSDGVRWLRWNLVSLCYNCHINKVHGRQSDAVWMERYLEILHGLIPDVEWENVVQIGNEVNKFSTSDLRDAVVNGWWNNEKP